MRQFVLIVVALILAGCATRAPYGDKLAQKIYLPRTVAIGDDDHYPDGFYLSRDPPSSLDKAVDAVVRAIPKVPITVETNDVCMFSSFDEMDAGLMSCQEAACERLPATSRGRGCGYLGQLELWIEDAWLGGQCRFKLESRSGPLISWFRRRGIHECHEMSTVLSIAIAQSMLGDRQRASVLIRPFHDESPEAARPVED